ncbi:MAG: ATP-binding cassette domain-containing protein [Spartobacteria bacterium]|nr:ATP-binding cassette domain-containing protein [Spartobacteria bacterium]
MKKRAKSVSKKTSSAPVRSGNPVLTLRDVRKVREKGDSRFELLLPEVTVWSGEFIAIVGESGCGKSTLLDMLGLVLRPTDAGTFSLLPAADAAMIDLRDKSPGELAAVRQELLGYVLQTGGLLPFLSVWENIVLPCRINGMSNYDEHVRGVCERLKIGDQLTKKPAFLSGGQRQRVAIARALAHRPPIILADEPTAAVDKLTAYEIRDTFCDLCRQMNVTVLVVSHDLELMAGAADRMYTFDVERGHERGGTVSICRERGLHE